MEQGEVTAHLEPKKSLRLGQTIRLNPKVDLPQALQQLLHVKRVLQSLGAFKGCRPHVPECEHKLLGRRVHGRAEELAEALEGVPRRGHDEVLAAFGRFGSDGEPVKHELIDVSNLLKPGKETTKGNNNCQARRLGGR